jgi:hypothetical protein
MTSRSIILTLICLAGAGSLSAFHGDQSARVTIGDAPPVPGTIDAVWRDVSAVVYGRVTKALPPRVGGSAQHPTVSRPYEVNVIELIKPDPQQPIGSTIELVIFGGTAEVNGKLISSESAVRPLLKEDAAVLFLKRRAEPNSYVLAYGPSAILKIDSQRGTAVIPNGMRAFPLFSDNTVLGLPDLLNKLRTVRR